jgi:hypothetical protein
MDQLPREKTGVVSEELRGSQRNATCAEKSGIKSVPARTSPQPELTRSTTQGKDSDPALLMSRMGGQQEVIAIPCWPRMTMASAG